MLVLCHSEQICCFYADLQPFAKSQLKYLEHICFWHKPTQTNGVFRPGLVQNSRTNSLHTKVSGGKKEMSAVGAEAKEVWLTWVSSRQVYLKP